MAELADALDLESSSRGVQVRFLLPAPTKTLKTENPLLLLDFSVFYFPKMLNGIQNGIKFIYQF